MANYPRWVMEMTIKDGVKRDSTIAFYVPEATAKLYFAAADKAARDATAIGGLFAKILTVTAGTEVMRRVYVEDKVAPVAAVDDSVLRGNKIVVGYQAGPKNLSFTVPARDATSYTQKTDSPEIDIQAAGDFKTFYEDVQTVAVAENGLAISVTKAYLND